MTARKNESSMEPNERLAVLETTILNINSNLLDIRHRFDKIDDRLDALEKKLDKKFDSLQSRLWSNFMWTISMIIGLAGLIAHAQHWI